jgi:ABC-type uncharacterized transport system YnjBCD ATPase subunit
MRNSEIQLPPYPVLSLQAAIRDNLETGRIPVIHAPPGSGKSTLVPFFLLNAAWVKGRTILLLQPRLPTWPTCLPGSAENFFDPTCACRQCRQP